MQQVKTYWNKPKLLRQTETRCSKPKLTATGQNMLQRVELQRVKLQRVETYCNKSKHIGTNRNILQQSETYCNRAKHIATSQNVLQRVKTYYNESKGGFVSLSTRLPESIRQSIKEPGNDSGGQCFKNPQPLKPKAIVGDGTDTSSRRPASSQLTQQVSSAGNTGMPSSCSMNHFRTQVLDTVHAEEILPVMYPGGLSHRANLTLM